MLDATQIIEAMGGREAVMREFGVSRTAVYNWLRDGIPSKFWLDFVEKAAARGIHGVTADAMKATRNRTREAA